MATRRIFAWIMAALLLSGSYLFGAEYTVDKAHTSVGFKVRHLMITNVRGSFKEFSGTADFDTKSMAFNALEATVDVKSIDTGIEKRDKHLRSEDFFFADKHPQLKFSMTGYKADGDEGKMSGNLTMRGITKPVEMEVEIVGVQKDFNGQTRVGFSMEGKVNREDFGLTWNRALETGGVVVGDTVTIEIEGQLVPN